MWSSPARQTTNHKCQRLFCFHCVVVCLCFFSTEVSRDPTLAKVLRRLTWYPLQLRCPFRGIATGEAGFIARKLFDEILQPAQAHPYLQFLPTESPYNSAAGRGDIARKASQIEHPMDKMSGATNQDMSIVDIDKWTSSLARILEDVPPYMCSPGHPGRISRIPQNLREVDLKAYEPCLLSLGPYHHGNPRVEPMEKRKRVVLKCFLQQKPDFTLKYYLKEFKSIEKAARSFYSDIEMDSEKFVQMLLLDSFYIVTVFCGMAKRQEWMNHANAIVGKADTEDIEESLLQINKDNGDDEMMVRVEASHSENNADTPSWFWTYFTHDLFLLENQLPFFVLQKIHSLAFGGLEEQLIKTTRGIVSNMLSSYTSLDPETVIIPNDEVHHLLHLSHLFFRPTLQQEPTTCELSESNEMFRLGSAVQLYKAGVAFEVRSASVQNCLLDITFNSSGKLSMPYLHVDDNTNSLLRNLVALEQMKYPIMGLNVSAYVVLLLHLATTPDDVKLLRRKGIIEHHLASDKDMMLLVNRLSVGLAFDYAEDEYCLKHIFQELKRYTERDLPRWRAWLGQKYFRNPWTAISLFAASLLLLLTALQTFYAVYSYYRPCFNCNL